MKNGKVLEQVTGVGGRHGVTLDPQGHLYVANPASRSVKKTLALPRYGSAITRSRSMLVMIPTGCLPCVTTSR
jgi:hypothetical protein